MADTIRDARRFLHRALVLFETTGDTARVATWLGRARGALGSIVATLDGDELREAARLSDLLVVVASTLAEIEDPDESEALRQAQAARDMELLALLEDALAEGAVGLPSVSHIAAQLSQHVDVVTDDDTRRRLLLAITTVSRVARA